MKTLLLTLLALPLLSGPGLALDAETQPIRAGSEQRVSAERGGVGQMDVPSEWSSATSSATARVDDGRGTPYRVDDGRGTPYRVDDGRGTPYIVEKSNNICGLDEPRQLTKPAKVDYEALLEATEEVKKIKKDKIDPNSSEGITLMAKARARVLKACESVRAADGYCSVWKDIKRRDKRAIDDITDAVKRQL